MRFFVLFLCVYLALASMRVEVDHPTFTRFATRTRSHEWTMRWTNEYGIGTWTIKNYQIMLVGTNVTSSDLFDLKEDAAQYLAGNKTTYELSRQPWGFVVGVSRCMASSLKTDLSVNDVSTLCDTTPRNGGWAFYPHNHFNRLITTANKADVTYYNNITYINETALGLEQFTSIHMIDDMAKKIEL